MSADLRPPRSAPRHPVRPGTTTLSLASSLLAGTLLCLLPIPTRSDPAPVPVQRPTADPERHLALNIPARPLSPGPVIARPLRPQSHELTREDRRLLDPAIRTAYIDADELLARIGPPSRAEASFEADFSIDAPSRRSRRGPPRPDTRNEMLRLLADPPASERSTDAEITPESATAAESDRPTVVAEAETRPARRRPSVSTVPVPTPSPRRRAAPSEEAAPEEPLSRVASLAPSSLTDAVEVDVAATTTETSTSPSASETSDDTPASERGAESTAAAANGTAPPKGLPRPHPRRATEKTAKDAAPAAAPEPSETPPEPETSAPATPETTPDEASTHPTGSPGGAGTPATPATHPAEADAAALPPTDEPAAATEPTDPQDAVDPTPAVATDAPPSSPATPPAPADGHGDGSPQHGEADTHPSESHPSRAHPDEADPATEAEGHHDAAEAERDETGEPATAEAPPVVLPPGPDPAALVRMLTALQDDVARGSGAAFKAQSILARRIAERFLAAHPSEWSEPRNTRALIIYALSGGNPAVVRKVQSSAELPSPYDEMLAGALAYLEGRAKDSKRHFETLRLEDLDASIRGALLLAYAAITVGDDAAAARELLDKARIAAPGTLVEEAALRRAILIAAEKNNLADFQRMVSRYLRKYRASIYAGNFRRRLAAALTRMSFIDEPAAFVRLETMLEPMTVAGRQELYLLLARAAVENGNRLAAEIAAQRVQETAPPGELDHRRARLYEAAAQVVDPERFAGAVATLNSLDAATLPEDDRALLRAALSLSSTVTDLPIPEAIASLGPDAELAPDSATESTADPFAEIAAMEGRVAAALAAVDTLLEDTP
ncbi:hypothetical protein [Acuticoccus mangrovi]|uniref:Chemotaxis protein n=1 Tax=Acuticoccus mangrovi TaxID=2796142 RepID=A0A934MP14_9HYPH|nr:hypothetical protein [Acuticoccus mangrovi]MBJ3778694.1 hypothetical protein [Acuticoccus mangrovi]